MALVNDISTKRTKERSSVHDPVFCSYTVFTDRSGPVLQVDTYRRSDPAGQGNPPQTIQLTRESALQLKALIEQTFS